MSAAPLLLVVLAAILHASWNLLAKRAAPIGPVFVAAYNLVACIVYAPWAVALLLEGAVPFQGAVVGLILLSGVIHLAYSLCLQEGYRQADFSVVYPVARGTGPMLSTFGAILLLGEVPTGRGVLGLALVVIGIGLIATDGRLSGLGRSKGPIGLLWGMATGGLIAAYTVTDAYAVKVLGIAPVVLDWFSNLLRLVVLAPLAVANPRRANAAMRGAWPLAVGVGLLSSLSYILVLDALGRGAPLSLVAPMREMSMMVGALLGLVVLGEPVGPRRLGGCALLIGGVILLAA